MHDTIVFPPESFPLILQKQHSRKQIHPSQTNTGKESNKIAKCNYCTKPS